MIINEKLLPRWEGTAGGALELAVVIEPDLVNERGRITQLAANAGDEGATVVQNVRAKKGNVGYNAETGESIGTARFGSRSRYLRPRQLQTEDPKDKSSAKYQEVIMRFVPDQPDLPIGLPVLVRPDTK